MKNLEFELSNKKWCLRWKNWENFVDKERSVFNKKKNNVCVLFVCCNSFHLFKRCYKYLDGESNQNFDILVIDNSTDEENIKMFHDVGIKNKRISILKPIWNIGWSGWFSIWMEYIISESYDYIIIFEDDIIPVDKDIISSMISKLDKNVIIQSNYINTYNSIFIQWWVFHLSWYPISFLKKIWVSSPMYFLKWDDAEFETRIKTEIRKWTIEIKNTWKYFFHPHQKKDWWKNRVLAFSIRNYLHILQESFKFWRLVRDIKEQFLYIWYWFSKLFIEWNMWVLRIYISSILDFLFWHIWYRWNLKLMNRYREIKITKPNTETIEVRQNEINKYTKNKYYIYAKIMAHDNLFGQISYSNKFIDWIKNWIIAWGIYNPIYPIFMCFKNILFLEEYDYEKDIIKAEIYSNKYYILTIIWIIFSFLITIPIYITMMTIVLLKIMFNRFFRVLKN